MLLEENRLFDQAQAQYERKMRDPPEPSPQADRLLRERAQLLERVRDLERQLLEGEGIEVVD